LVSVLVGLQASSATMTTPSDQAVLNAIFNPLMPGAEGPEENDRRAAAEIEEEASSPEAQKSKEFEVSGVKAAEVGNIVESIQLFTKAIEICPERASGYNNRAQAFRLLQKVDDALADLNKAIELSEGRGRAACQASVQRGMIERLRGNDDLARADFEKAAGLGSQFAKTQLVIMNPYAAMCNKMLHDVIGKLQRGEPEDSCGSDRPA